MVASIYDLPDLRPFRTIQHRMRLAGGAIVTENGLLASDDFDGTTFDANDGTTGWAIWGTGDASFNRGRFRGSLEASSLIADVDGAEQIGNGTFDVDTTGWSASGFYSLSQIARVTSPVRTGAGALELDGSAAGTVAAVWKAEAVSEGDVYHVTAWVRKNALDADDANNVIALEILWMPTTGGLLSELNIEHVTAAEVLIETADEWQLIELYGYVPGGLVTDFWLRIRGYFDTGQEIYVDDVSAAVAPQLVVPYIVTSNDPDVPAKAHLSGTGLRLTNEHHPNIDAGMTLDGEWLALRAPALISRDDGYLRMRSRVLSGFTLDLLAEHFYLNDEDLLGVWTDYTPSNTNITLGNGTQVAKYKLVGKTCFVRWSLVWGNTTSFGGNVSVGMPFEADADGYQTLAGHYIDAGTRNYVGSGRIAPSGTVADLMHTETGGSVAATSPFTFTTSDRLQIAGVYEIA